MDIEIGKVYNHNDNMSLCWSFCHYAGKILGLSLPCSVWEMHNAGVSPILFSIVLFHLPDNSWHTGIVYPDCVHYIHATNRLGVNVVRQDRLNHEVNQFVKGYYVTD